MLNKIVLVDDVPDNLNLLEDLLDNEFNYNNDDFKVEFIKANDGQEALDIIKDDNLIDGTIDIYKVATKKILDINLDDKFIQVMRDEYVANFR